MIYLYRLEVVNDLVITEGVLRERCQRIKPPMCLVSLQKALPGTYNKLSPLWVL
jgi:hypothetical protein